MRKPSKAQQAYWNKKLADRGLGEDAARLRHDGRLAYVGVDSDIETHIYMPLGEHRKRKMGKAKRQAPQVSRWLSVYKPVRDTPASYPSAPIQIGTNKKRVYGPVV
jgi:hypothetical protein